MVRSDPETALERIELAMRVGLPESAFKMKLPGWTMVELLMAVTVSALILSAALATHIHGVKVFHQQARAAVVQQNLRAALYHLEREIRMAGLDPSGTSGARIIEAQSNRIRFSEDMDGDGMIDGNEDIVYALDDTDGDGNSDELDRNNWTVAQYITALEFVYLDESGMHTLTSGHVRSVSVTVTARAPGGLQRSLTAFIACRNLRY